MTGTSIELLPAAEAGSAARDGSAPAAPAHGKFAYRRDIDGLRAIAVAPVVLFHAGLGIPGGYVGVDIFFVISGFLITSLLLKDIEAGKFSIAKFYERRARRILPALTFLLLCVTLVAILFYPPAQLAKYGERLFHSAIFTANIHFWKISDYFAPRADDLELLHVWSLAVEEQFYLLFPPVLWLASRWRQGRWLVALLGLGLAGSLALSIAGVVLSPYATFYLLPTRAWELLLGAVLATGAIPASARLGPFSAVLGLFMIAVAIFTFNDATPFPGLAAVLPCLGAALVIYSGQHDPSRPVFAPLATRPMVGFGLISYSLYLWHWPLLVMPAMYLGRALAPWESTLAVAAALVLATLSWKYVENPFRRRPRGPTSPTRPLLVAAIAIVAVAALGLFLWKGDGLPGRAPPITLDIEAQAADGMARFYREEASACRVGADGSDSCPPADNAVVVWGDSHVMQLLPGIRESFADSPVLFYGQGGCPAVTGVSFVIAPRRHPTTPGPNSWAQAESCRQLNDRILAAILARENVRLVVMSGAWEFFTRGRKLITGEGRYAVADPSQPLTVATSQATLAEGLRRTVSALSERGIRVLVVGDTPQFDYYPPLCLARKTMAGEDPGRCESGYDLAYLERSNALIAGLDALPGVDVMLPSTALCRQGRCPLLSGSTLLYMDPDHISPEVSRRLMRHYVGQGTAPAASR